MDGIDFLLNAAMLHLNMVEVKGEMNMNNQLVAIQKIREARKMLKEMSENENHDEQRTGV
ncbi:MAG: hypothetical protein E7321_08940 [Clostridiales bacterium]|nr:hypothetical protein [Clostridiales bacterium]